MKLTATSRQYNPRCSIPRDLPAEKQSHRESSFPSDPEEIQEQKAGGKASVQFLQ